MMMMMMTMMMMVVVTAAAAPMEAGRLARDTAALLYGAGAPSHAAPMLFDGRQVSLAGAAYAAATQTDNLDAHDGYNPVKGHIGVAVIPAMLALAEQAEGFTGAPAITVEAEEVAPIWADLRHRWVMESQYVK